MNSSPLWKRAIALTLSECLSARFSSQIAGHPAGRSPVREETIFPPSIVTHRQSVAVYTRDPNKWHQFKPHSSVRYDARTMTLHHRILRPPRALDGTARRRPVADFEDAQTFARAIELETVYRKGNFFLHISITIPAPDVKQPQGSLGVLSAYSRSCEIRQEVSHGAEYPPQESLLQKAETISPGQRQ